MRWGPAAGPAAVATVGLVAAVGSCLPDAGHVLQSLARGTRAAADSDRAYT